MLPSQVYPFLSIISKTLSYHAYLILRPTQLIPYLFTLFPINPFQTYSHSLTAQLLLYQLMTLNHYLQPIYMIFLLVSLLLVFVIS
jgi:hypothetical protein